MILNIQTDTKGHHMSVMLIYETDSARLKDIIRNAGENSLYREYQFEGFSKNTRDQALIRLEDEDVKLVSWCGMEKTPKEAAKLLGAMDKIAAQH